RGHPRGKLALLKLGLRYCGRSFEDVLLAGAFEVACNRLLQRRFVLLDHLAHTIKLIDPPRMGAGDVASKIGLLGVKYTLKRIHCRLLDRWIALECRLR